MKLTIHGHPLPHAVSYDTHREGEDGCWEIAEEVPIAFVFNRRNYSVMMATPADLVDYAVGFALTESVIRHVSDIVSLDIYQTDQGVDLRFRLTSDGVERLDLFQRRRNLVGRASCGLCGLENADVLFRRLDPVIDDPVRIEAAIVLKALRGLRDHQPLNTQTRTVHAAAWANLDGSILIVREDVGRHNALDKLLGALAMEQADKAQGFVIMSSRCSYEIVEKAASQGIRALVTVSAPTAFALRKAKEAHLTIYTRAANGVVRLGASRPE